MTDIEISAFLRRTPERTTPVTQTTQAAAKKRVQKQDCLELRFSGVIRLPINASDVSTITAANAEMTARVEAVKKAIGAGGEIASGAAKFGKMDAKS